MDGGRWADVMKWETDMTATVVDRVRPSHLLIFFIPILCIFEMVVDRGDVVHREKEMYGLYQVPLVYPQFILSSEGNSVNNNLLLHM